MAKSKTKISSTQRDKIAIARAKALKKAGILSKQTKLHGGQYISARVLKKVKEYSALIDHGYKAHSAPRDVVKAAKDRGFLTIGGTKVVGPSKPKFRNNLKQGVLTGVQPLRKGYMEVIDLPHSIYDLHGLYEALGDDGLNSLKDDNEIFAFSFHGNMQRANAKPFRSTQELREYLFQYKGIQSALMSNSAEAMTEELNAISIIRIRNDDQHLFIPRPSQRRLLHAARGTTYPRKRGRGEGLSIEKQEALRKKRAEKAAKKRARMTEAQLEKVRKQNRESLARRRARDRK